MKYIIVLLLSLASFSASAQLIGKGGWRIVAEGRPGTTEINDVATNQDFATLYQIPAGALVAGKKYKVTVDFEFITGVSTVTLLHQIEVGGVAVYTTGSTDYANSVTRTSQGIFVITGTAAAGASVSVLCSAVVASHAASIQTNTIDQTPGPVIATNAAQNINFSITYSGTGSTESVTLLSYLVEESF